MEEKNKDILRYFQAVSCLTPRLMNEAMRIPDALGAQVEEVRLRCGGPLTLVREGQELALDGEVITAAELREILSRASRSTGRRLPRPNCARSCLGQRAIRCTAIRRI